LLVPQQLGDHRPRQIADVAPDAGKVIICRSSVEYVSSNFRLVGLASSGDKESADYASHSYRSNSSPQTPRSEVNYYVDDLCQAILSALQSDVTGELFQVATSTETNLELVACFNETTWRSFQIDRAPPCRGDIRHNYSAVHKAREQSGWTSQVSLMEGLKKTWAWFQ